MDINEYFDRVYCINLDRRADRWEATERELEAAGIVNYERFSAIESADGVVGCKASHLAVIADARDSGFERILIFEDDVQISPHFSRTIGRAISELGSLSWDLLYLGGNTARLENAERLARHWYRIEHALTTHAYAVNRSVYEFILSEVAKEDLIDPTRHRPIDYIYSTRIMPRRDVLMVHPMLCSQRESYSDIQQRQVDYSPQIRGIESHNVSFWSRMFPAWVGYVVSKLR